MNVFEALLSPLWSNATFARDSICEAPGLSSENDDLDLDMHSVVGSDAGLCCSPKDQNTGENTEPMSSSSGAAAVDGQASPRVSLSASARKKVSFGSAVKVILVATRREVRAAGLAEAAWWQGRDYEAMKRSAARELLAYARAERADPRTALRLLYQPRDEDFVFAGEEEEVEKEEEEVEDREEEGAGRQRC
jgi:hypothetical protein